MVMVCQVCQKVQFEGILDTGSEEKRISFVTDVCGDPANYDYANASFKSMQEWVLSHGPMRRQFYGAGFSMNYSFRHETALPVGNPFTTSRMVTTYDDKLAYCYNGESWFYGLICSVMLPDPPSESCGC